MWVFRFYSRTNTWKHKQIQRMFWGLRQNLSKSTIISPEKALPGRDEPVVIAQKHYVLHNPIQPPFPSHLQTCVFATGCFWGTEKGFWRLPGVYTTAVGYAGGYTKNPTYDETCSGMTGHAEVVLVVYDPSIISFADLLHLFWISHDPTQGMGQGNDSGTQYRSGIYVNNEEQRQIAQASKTAYQAALSAKNYGSITTEIVGPPTVPFYYAEDYHQQYLAKPGSRQYCSAQPTEVRFPDSDTWIPKDIKDREAKLAKLPEEFWKKHGPKRGCTIEFPNEQVQWLSSL